MGLLRTAAGIGITVIIGGTAYTVNKEDVVDNFADDTGLTQQQAEQYVNNVNEEDLVSYNKLGTDFVSDGQTVLSSASQIDCVNYKYDWESTSLSCEEGKSQLHEVGNDEIALGHAYIKLNSDSASDLDISATIALIDEVNSDYELEVVDAILDARTVDESKKANSYNKATLQAALESN